MSRPKTLLEDLSAYVLSVGAQILEVEHKDGCEWVYIRHGNTGHSIANFKSSGRDAKELRENLFAAQKKPPKIAVGGSVWILTLEVYNTCGEDAFRVHIQEAPKPDASEPPRFTKKQGQYLAYIYAYSKIHRQAPSELDLQTYFRTSPPSVHDMIKTLELNGFIERIPRQARSIRLLVRPEHLPALE
jgi:repressor LexA